MAKQATQGGPTSRSVKNRHNGPLLVPFRKAEVASINTRMTNAGK